MNCCFVQFQFHYCQKTFSTIVALVIFCSITLISFRDYLLFVSNKLVWVLKRKILGQKSTYVLKENQCSFLIQLLTVVQKLVILSDLFSKNMLLRILNRKHQKDLDYSPIFLIYIFLFISLFRTH